MTCRVAASFNNNYYELVQTSESGAHEKQGAQQWREQLEECLENNTMAIYLQPVVSRDQKKLVHFEVLARMPTSTGETLPGGSFLPMAERLGMMPLIDQTIILNTLKLAQQSSTKEVLFSINLSPSSTNDQAFISWLGETLQQYRDVANRINLELNEGNLEQSKAVLKPLTERLSQTDSTLSLDHFGIGFSSFGYLTNLPARYVKIDRSHIQNIHQQKESRFFVHSLADIAHGLGIQVIAEGIENELQVEALLALPIDALQGYYVARPMAAEKAFEQYLDQ